MRNTKLIGKPFDDPIETDEGKVYTAEFDIVNYRTNDITGGCIIALTLGESGKQDKLNVILGPKNMSLVDADLTKQLELRGGVALRYLELMSRAYLVAINRGRDVEDQEGD